MDELISAIQNPHALITLAVLSLAIVLFITGWLAPELTGLLSLGLLISTGDGRENWRLCGVLAFRPCSSAPSGWWPVPCWLPRFRALIWWPWRLPMG